MRISEIISEAVRQHHVFHCTDWGAEIFSEGKIRANSTIDVAALAKKSTDLSHDLDHHPIKGVCVTRSFHFAKQFATEASTIFGLDVDLLRRSFKMLPRAEAGAYNLADDHGDYRLEAEEFVICPGLELSRFLTSIWVHEGSRRDAEYRALIADQRFKGFFRN